MRVLYLDCKMGASGDMLAAALLELIAKQDKFIAEMNKIGIPNVKTEKRKQVKYGVKGTRFTVTVDGKEEETDISLKAEMRTGDIRKIGRIVKNLHVSNKVKADVTAVYRLIAEAESRVHGVPVGDVHFRSIGALDALADITAVSLLIEKLKPLRVTASPVHVGCGSIECACGTLPVPAPATARILKGIPIYGGAVKGELCTPTGAALLKHFAADFGEMPGFKYCSCGYGIGKRDFKMPSGVGAYFGETKEA